MHAQAIVFGLGLLNTVSAMPRPQPQSTPNVQTLIQGADTAINSLINDIVRSDAALIQADFLTVEGELGSIFSAVVPAPGSCPVGTPAPATDANSAIQYLQQVQLMLSDVSLAVIDQTSAQPAICSALGLLGAVSGFISSITTSTITSSVTSTTTFGCNLAHSYLTPITCVLGPSGPTFSTITSAPATTTTASVTTFACNPAHSYPSPITCVINSTGPVFSTITPAPTTTSTSALACNPAHSYPSPITCVIGSSGPAFSTVTPAPNSTTTA